MSKKIIIAIVIIALIVAGIVWRVLAPKTIEDAIAYIDNGSYTKALKVLETLAKTSDYESGERVYYYRVKALLGFINKLNEDYADERNEIDKTKNKKIEEKLKNKLYTINKKTGLDLILITNPRCYIFTEGKLYDEFVSLYPGSRFIEAIDLEMLQFSMDMQPATIHPVMEFYKRYPHTTYLSTLVNILLKALANPKIEVKGYSEKLTEMLQSFCNKYSSSAEYYRLFRCKGENVNLRDSAGTHGQITGKLNKGEFVIQLERSMDSVQIGDVRDYWYRVVSVSGSRGWVFGKFLERIEPLTGAVAQNEESFTIDERFNEWIDSHTPKGWQHVFAGFEDAISFTKLKDRNIVKIDAREKGGLYKKTGSFQNMVCKVKGRLIEGDIILAGIVGYGGLAALITLLPQEVDVCGYKIPYVTTQWHEYELRSEGKTLSLFIDGELVARKISAKKHDMLQSSGIYILVSHGRAKAEIEYIRVK
ncbi:MAG: SH3 domain-containing protein [Spirochaetes bacterium]|nr:SH3 domain-containing protein [Spirochaetota bacterium]